MSGNVRDIGGGRREVTLCIKGQLPRKENDRQIVRGKGGKPISIKSDKALAYVEGFAYQVPPEARLGLGSAECPLSITGTVFYPWKRRGDLSVELLLDALQERGVISNDNLVVELYFLKGYSKDDPRVEVTIRELPGWDWEIPPASATALLLPSALLCHAVEGGRRG